MLTQAYDIFIHIKADQQTCIICHFRGKIRSELVQNNSFDKTKIPWRVIPLCLECIEDASFSDKTFISTCVCLLLIVWNQMNFETCQRYSGKNKSIVARVWCKLKLKSIQQENQNVIKSILVFNKTDKWTIFFSAYNKITNFFYDLKLRFIIHYVQKNKIRLLS